jgi:hypothetical protein
MGGSGTTSTLRYYDKIHDLAAAVYQEAGCTGRIGQRPSSYAYGVSSQLRALRCQECNSRSVNAVVVSRSMPEVLNALVAFIAEHRRCGVLDGGIDNGYAWLQCSCGGLIMRPKRESPKTPAGT